MKENIDLGDNKHFFESNGYSVELYLLGFDYDNEGVLIECEIHIEGFETVEFRNGIIQTNGVWELEDIQDEQAIKAFFEKAFPLDDQEFEREYFYKKLLAEINVWISENQDEITE